MLTNIQMVGTWHGNVPQPLETTHSERPSLSQSSRHVLEKPDEKPDENVEPLQFELESLQQRGNNQSLRLQALPKERRWTSPSLLLETLCTSNAAALLGDLDERFCIVIRIK